jgi:hypothetical protein
MILNPSILALMLSSGLLALFICYAFLISIRIIQQWDISSGSELQLNLERSTYLISTIMSMVLTVQLMSLFLFIFTADALHNQLSGAMCAAGSLNANIFGYPALAVKIVTFLLCAVWLVINHVDNCGYDYPLIRPKYIFLQLLTPLIIIEALLQSAYFINLKANVLTSCCGTQFGGGGNSSTAAIISLPPVTGLSIFYGTMAAALVSGIIFLVARRGAIVIVFSIFSGVALLVGIVSLIAFISPYYYELPTHHCPFDILQGEYRYIGYPLYLALLGGGAAGLSSGVLQMFRGEKSLLTVIPSVQKRLVTASVAMYSIFVLLVSWKIIFSNLIMVGS